MKLLICNKNPAMHFATLDFKIPFNETHSLDSQNQTPTKNDENQKVCLEGTGLLLCQAWELSNCDSNKHNRDMSDKDTDKERLCAFLQKKQLDLVMTWISWAHLHFIQEKCILSNVEVPCSGCILNLALIVLQLLTRL